MTLSYVPIFFVLGGIMYLLFELYSLRSTLVEVESQLRDTAVKLEMATARNRALEDLMKEQEQSTSDMQTLLKHCYDDLNSKEARFEEINKIMNNEFTAIPSPPVNTTPSTDIKEVSPPQVIQGMDFVNRQLNRLKNLDEGKSK